MSTPQDSILEALMAQPGQLSGLRSELGDGLERYRQGNLLSRYRLESREPSAAQPALLRGGGSPQPSPDPSAGTTRTPGWLRWEYALGVFVLAGLAGLLHALFGGKQSPEKGTRS
jgi:hypothetical protein